MIFGVASLPAWRIAQPASEESNSLMKKRGNGVGVGSRVGVAAGVLVRGIEVCDAGMMAVLVGKSGMTEVGVADWQAVIKRRHPRRSFFMMLIKTQLPRRLFQAIKF